MWLKKDKKQNQSFLSWFCCQRQKKYPSSLLRCCPGEQDRDGAGAREVHRLDSSISYPHPGLSSQLCEASFSGQPCPFSSKERALQRHHHFGMFRKACPEACQFLTLCSLACLRAQRESPVRNICSSRSCFVRKNMEALFQVLFLPLSLSQVRWHDINLISKFKGLNSIFLCDW